MSVTDDAYAGRAAEIRIDEVNMKRVLVKYRNCTA